MVLQGRETDGSESMLTWFEEYGHGKRTPRSHEVFLSEDRLMKFGWSVSCLRMTHGRYVVFIDWS